MLPICARCAVRFGMYSSRGMSGGRVVEQPGVVVGVFPEVLAAAIPAVEPGRPLSVELLRRAHERFVDRARRQVGDEQLAGGRRQRVGREQHAVLIEVGVDRHQHVAIPRRGARQRARGRVVGGVAGVDGVLPVVRPGRAEARLDHLAERNLVHLVLAAGRASTNPESVDESLRSPWP